MVWKNIEKKKITGGSYNSTKILHNQCIFDIGIGNYDDDDDYDNGNSCNY